MEVSTEGVKYDKPLSAAVQTTADARALLLAHASDLATHIARASGVDIGQVISTAISTIATAEPRTQTALLHCTGTTILKSVADAARYGLVFGNVFGQAYLVPFKDTCTLIVGYRGLETLAYRGGVRAMQSAVVYEGDSYDVELGRQPPILHKPDPNANHKPEKIVAAYAFAIMEPGLALAESMNRQDLDAIRARSRAGSSGPYVTDPAEMFRKAPVRRLCKHLPLSPAIRALMDEILTTEDAVAVVHPAHDVIEAEARASELLTDLGPAREPGDQG